MSHKSIYFLSCFFFILHSFMLCYVVGAMTEVWIETTKLSQHVLISCHLAWHAVTIIWAVVYLTLDMCYSTTYYNLSISYFYQKHFTRLAFIWALWTFRVGGLYFMWHVPTAKTHSLKSQGQFVHVLFLQL